MLPRPTVCIGSVILLPPRSPSQQNHAQQSRREEQHKQSKVPNIAGSILPLPHKDVALDCARIIAGSFTLEEVTAAESLHETLRASVVVPEGRNKRHKENNGRTTFLNVRRTTWKEMGVKEKRKEQRRTTSYPLWALLPRIRWLESSSLVLPASRL